MFKFHLFLGLTLGINAISFAMNAQADNSSIMQPRPRSGASGKEEIAYVDRNDDKDLYDRSENANNWNYQQNWQNDSNAYLRGQNNPSQNNSNEYNYQPRSGNYYQGNYKNNNYYQPEPNNNVNSPTINRSWDYRENWKYNPGPYLRGEDQSEYNEELIKENKMRGYSTTRKKSRYNNASSMANTGYAKNNTPTTNDANRNYSETQYPSGYNYSGSYTDNNRPYQTTRSYIKQQKN
ncbi:MAG: hypothetical protein H0W88_02640 [Parachlamydiaceae bacterium]|nr:hypothetical protein [Parachlamydiaceae bacterium]